MKMFETKILRLEEITEPIFKEGIITFIPSDFEEYDRYRSDTERFTFLTEKGWKTPLGAVKIEYETRESIRPEFRMWFRTNETAEPYLHIDILLFAHVPEINVFRGFHFRRWPIGIKQITLTSKPLGLSTPDFKGYMLSQLRKNGRSFCMEGEEICAKEFLRQMLSKSDLYFPENFDREDKEKLQIRWNKAFIAEARAYARCRL